MINKPIIIVSGEPYSVFLEIFFKILKSNYLSKYKKPLILIASKNLVEMQMKKMNFAFKINLIKQNQISKIQLSNAQINLIDVKLNIKKPFGKISTKSSKYINKCFNIGIKNKQPMIFGNPQERIIKSENRITWSRVAIDPKTTQPK